MKLTIASKITIIRMVLIPLFIAGYLCCDEIWQIILPTVIFVIASLSDYLDGYLARSRNEVTNFGKFMDPIADKLLVMAAFVVLVSDGRMSALSCIIILAREFVISGFRLIAVEQGKVLAATWLAKWKTTVQMIAIILMLLHNFPFAYLNIPMDIIFEWGAVLMTVWSGADYLIKNKGVLRENKDEPI